MYRPWGHFFFICLRIVYCVCVESDRNGQRTSSEHAKRQQQNKVRGAVAMEALYISLLKPHIYIVQFRLENFPFLLIFIEIAIFSVESIYFILISRILSAFVFICIPSTRKLSCFIVYLIKL